MGKRRNKYSSHHPDVVPDLQKKVLGLRNSTPLLTYKSQCRSDMRVTRGHAPEATAERDVCRLRWAHTMRLLAMRNLGARLSSSSELPEAPLGNCGSPGPSGDKKLPWGTWRQIHVFGVQAIFSPRRLLLCGHQ
eukprot:7367564-Pyramimonas_sp.AAC.1